MIKRIAIAVIASALVAQALFGDVWQDLANYEYGDESKAGEAVEALLQETPAGEYGRLEQGLIGVVTSRNATQAGKAIACRMLQQVGTETCIPAVSALLGDEVLSHYARLVLERLKGEKANQAMREALAKAQDRHPRQPRRAARRGRRSVGRPTRTERRSERGGGGHPDARKDRRQPGGAEPCGPEAGQVAGACADAGDGRV